MIPYIEWTSFAIGPFTIYVWGLFVGLGFVLASLVAGWFAKQRGGDAKIIYDLTFWMLVTGFLGARLGYVLFYAPMDFWKHPLEIVRVWDGGMSMFGGLALSIVVGLWYLKRRRVDVWRYADAAMFGLPFGLWIGRIGCFLIHDHPGTATDFVLGVEYPDGVVRHDHGLYLSINGLLMGLAFLWLARKRRPPMFYMGVFALWYGAVRFFLDFFRIADVKYGYLTPAQYFSIALVVVGIWLLIKINRKKYE